MAYRKYVNNSVCWGRVIAAAIILMAVFSSYPSPAFGKQEPTAIIVDAETGKPIEGAIALAQWLKPSDKAGWFEGGRLDVKNAKEAYTDAEGKVIIDGFWSDCIFSKKPSLTVYKPGYILWYSSNDGTGKSVFNPAQIFSKKDNTIKLYKFEADYSMWSKQYPDIKYPHLEQDHWFSSFLNTGLHNGRIITFCDVYQKYETPFIRQEKDKQYRDGLNKKQWRNK